MEEASEMANSSPLPSSSDSKNETRLPYFHRTLSEEDSKLVGDITPKKIDSSVLNTPGSISAPVPAASGGSAWNAASSWEEKNRTEWATEHIRNQLFVSGSKNAFNLEGTKQIKDIEVISVTDVSGNANITHSRGKIRYMYEFTVDLSLHFYSTATEEPYKAIVKVEDCINDQLDDVVVSLSWPSAPPMEVANEARKFINGKIFKGFIVSTFKNFEAEYRNQSK